MKAGCQSLSRPRAGAGVWASADQPAQASTYTVTNTKDDNNPGSLRWTITQANSHPGPDSIVFDIPRADPGYDWVSGVWTISLGLDPLELENSGTTIDGTTQTDKFDSNLNGPEIQIMDNVIGGEEGYRNVIAGNSASGIDIFGTGSSGNTASTTISALMPRAKRIRTWETATAASVW